MIPLETREVLKRQIHLHLDSMSEKMAGYKSDINSTVTEEMHSAELHAEIKNDG